MTPVATSEPSGFLLSPVGPKGFHSVPLSILGEPGFGSRHLNTNPFFGSGESPMHIKGIVFGVLSHCCEFLHGSPLFIPATTDCAWTTPVLVMIKATPAKICVKFKTNDLIFISCANNLKNPEPIDPLRRDVSSWHRADQPRRRTGNVDDDRVCSNEMLMQTDPSNADTFLHCATGEKTWALFAAIGVPTPKDQGLDQTASTAVLQ